MKIDYQLILLAIVLGAVALHARQLWLWFRLSWMTSWFGDLEYRLGLWVMRCRIWIPIRLQIWRNRILFMTHRLRVRRYEILINLGLRAKYPTYRPREIKVPVAKSDHGSHE